MLVVIIGITLIIAVYLSVKIKNVGVVIDNYIKVDWWGKEIGKRGVVIFFGLFIVKLE